MTIFDKMIIIFYKCTYKTLWYFLNKIYSLTLNNDIKILPKKCLFCLIEVIILILLNYYMKFLCEFDIFIIL